jgi:hypothetical protein
MPRHHEIQIRFIRRLENGSPEPDSTRDDILRISRLDENSMRVVYTEKSDVKPVIDVAICTNQQLLAYLYRVFWATGLDEDPFKSVQFFVPGFPTFLFEVSTLKQQMPAVIDIITSLCWNWPTIGHPHYVGAPERASSHSLGIGGPEQPADSGDNGDSSDGAGGTANPSGLDGSI